MVHDDLGPVRHQHVGHLLGLGLRRIASDVGDGVDARADGAQGSAFAVLHGDTLAGLDADLLAREEVDGRVGLRGGLGQARGGAEDVVFGEVLGLVDLLHAGDDAAQRRRGHDRHAVFLGLVQLRQLLVGADAGLGFGLERGDDAILFHLDVALAFLVRELEVVLVLHAADDAAEVLAHEVFHQFRAGVAGIFALLFQDLVGERGAGFEGEFFRQHERVVAVEEEFNDLENWKGGI